MCIIYTQPKITSCITQALLSKKPRLFPRAHAETHTRMGLQAWKWQVPKNPGAVAYLLGAKHWSFPLSFGAVPDGGSMWRGGAPSMLRWGSLQLLVHGTLKKSFDWIAPKAHLVKLPASHGGPPAASGATQGNTTPASRWVFWGCLHL